MQSLMNYYTSIYNSDLQHRAIAVYLYLKTRTNKDNKCFPAIGTIAKDLKLSRSTVTRAIDDLEKSGFLTKDQRWRENGGKSSLMFYII
jgi:DNA-binding MarR family transcriptional regulator